MKLRLYRWTAINRLQQKQKGLLVAVSAQQIHQQLLQQGLQKIKVQQNWQFSTKPKSAEICELFVQLAILLKSSVPLKNSLLILLQNCTNLQLNQWLRNLVNAIEAGQSFSQALNHYDQFISLQERQLIQIGEMTGKLAEVCQQIAQSKQHNLALQRKLQKILLYPSLVLAISLILTALLLIFIVPQFADMYGDNAQLPLFTEILLSLSNILRNEIWLLLISIMLLFIAIKYALTKSLWLQQKKTIFLQKLPLLGNIIALARLVNFAKGLGVMLKSGVPLNQALQSFLPHKKAWQSKADYQIDFILVAEIQAILQGISQGHSFSAAVSTGLFPMQAKQMLQVGEQSGQLSYMLTYIAESYQQQLSHQIDLLSQMLEPVLMLIIGSLIGLIMLGMYMPIFNMGSVIQ